MNALYINGKALLLRGVWDDPALTIKAAVVDVSTGFAFIADPEFTDVLDYVIGTPVVLANRTVDDAGFATADDVVFSPITGRLGALVIYEDTGMPSTSTNIAYIEITGWPVNALASVITINWNALGIIALG